jgi:hypothetical protein
MQWGAGMGFSLCHTKSHETPPDSIFTLATCPWSIRVRRGMTATISGSISPYNELRVLFHEKGRPESTYIVATPTGRPTNYDFEDAEVVYDPTSDPINLDEIESVELMFAAADASEGEFDICISDISFY